MMTKPDKTQILINALQTLADRNNYYHESVYGKYGDIVLQYTFKDSFYEVWEIAQHALDEYNES